MGAAAAVDEEHLEELLLASVTKNKVGRENCNQWMVLSMPQILCRYRVE